MKIRRMVPVVILALAACSGADDPPDQKNPPQGRAETQNIRNTDAVGYSGSQIADKVDATLDATDARARRLEEEEEGPPAE